MKKSLLLPLAIVVLIGVFAGGFFVRTLFPVVAPACPLPSTPPPAAILPTEPIIDSQSTEDYKKGYDAGLEKARLAVVDMKCFQDTLQANSHRIAGTISSIADSTLELQLDASTLNPFLDGKIVKKITVTDKTVIQRQVPKSDADYQKEYLAYQSSIETLAPLEPGKEEAQARPEKPQKYSTQTLTFATLKTGDKISVETAGDAIKQDTFDATTINLYSSDQPAQANP